MAFFIEITILFLAAVIAILSEGRELINEKYKKRFRIAAICLIIVALIFQAADEWLKSAKERHEDEATSSDRQERVKKEQELLTQIKLAFDTIKGIQRNIDTQLSLQKSITTKANLLSAQNQAITSQQKRVYQNVDRLLNPN